MFPNDIATELQTGEREMPEEVEENKMDYDEWRDNQD